MRFRNELSSLAEVSLYKEKIKSVECLQDNLQLRPETLLCRLNPNYFDVFINFLHHHIDKTFF